MSFSSLETSFDSLSRSERALHSYGAVSQSSPDILCAQGFFDRAAREEFIERASYVFGSAPSRAPARASACGCDPVALAEYGDFLSCLEAVNATAFPTAQEVFEQCRSEFQAILGASDASGLAQSCYNCLTESLQGLAEASSSSVAGLAASCNRTDSLFSGGMASNCTAYGGEAGLLLFSMRTPEVVQYTPLASTGFARGVLHARVPDRRGEVIEVFCTQLTVDPTLAYASIDEGLAPDVPYYGNATSWEAENLRQMLELKDIVDAALAGADARALVMGDMGCAKQSSPVGYVTVGKWDTLGADSAPFVFAPRTCDESTRTEFCDWYFDNDYLRRCTYCGAEKYVPDHVYLRGVELQAGGRWAGEPLVAASPVNASFNINRYGIQGSFKILSSSTSSSSSLFSIF